MEAGLPQADTDEFVKIEKNAFLVGELEKSVPLGWSGAGLGDQLVYDLQPWPLLAGGPAKSCPSWGSQAPPPTLHPTCPRRLTFTHENLRTQMGHWGAYN